MALVRMADGWWHRRPSMSPEQIRQSWRNEMLAAEHRLGELGYPPDNPADPECKAAHRAGLQAARAAAKAAEPAPPPQPRKRRKTPTRKEVVDSGLEGERVELERILKERERSVLARMRKRLRKEPKP